MNNVRSGVAQRRPQKPQGLFAFTLSDKLLRRFDLLAWIVWGLAQTIIPMQSTAIRYLLSAYFAGMLLVRSRQFGGLLLTCWPMFLLPGLALVSSIWAPSASDAIRKSMLLALTSVIAIYVAKQLTGRQIIYTIFGINLLAAIASAIYQNPHPVGIAGIFSQKNVLALSMFFVMSSGIVLLFDRAAHWTLRGLAVAAMPLALWLLVKAESATILLLTIPMVFALAVQVLFWSGIQRVRHLRSLTALFALVLVSIATMALFGISHFDAVNSVLGSVGKDTTLTGRTVLWEQANRIIADHPWTGLGAEGFWRPEIGKARTLLEFFYYTNFTKLTFHNSYLENGVQFGYPGMFATYFLGGWCLYRSLRTWVMRQDLHNAFFLFLAIMIMARSFTETDLATELGWTFLLILICAARENPKAVRRRAPMAPPPMAARAAMGRGPPRR